MAPLPVPTPGTASRNAPLGGDIASADRGEGTGGLAPPSSSGLGWWLGAVAGLGALAAIVAGVAMLLRRRDRERGTEPEEVVSEEAASERVAATVAPAAAPVDRDPPASPSPSFLTRSPRPAPVPPPLAPAPAGPRARLGISFRPVRAGLNLLSATVECEVVIANASGGEARDVRLEVALISAHAGQDAEIAAIYDRAGGRPAVPLFTLLPGEERRIVTVAALPRTAIQVLTAGERPMFVPTVVVSLGYQVADGPAQTGRAYAVGVERVDSAKLAPIWLDQPPRMYDAVAARPHSAGTIER